MDFLYLQRGLENRPYHEMLYIRCTHITRVLFRVLYINPLEKSSSPYTLQTIVVLLFKIIPFRGLQ
jgi:hypothetical protein